MARKSKTSKKNMNKRKMQKGGDGNRNIQSVSMPIQYFGGKLNRYFPAGSPELKTPKGVVAKSFGTYDKSLTCASSPATAPNLFPFPGQTGLQTGGVKRRMNKKTKNKVKKTKSMTKSRTKSKSKTKSRK